MDWLEGKTGHGTVYWMARIQTLIAEHSTPPDDTGHGSTDSEAVLHSLVHEIVSHSPVSHPLSGIAAYDGNMYLFSVLAHITTLWYSTVQRAKLSDPKRPVGNAMMVYREMYLPWLLELQRILFDHSQDATYFPGQQWQNPFMPDAESGSFI